MNTESHKDKYNCQIFTPEDKVQYMLNLANYNENIENMLVLENSAGDGNFLIEIIKRLIKDLKSKNYSSILIKNKLETNIFAYEIDNNHYNNCIKRMNEVAHEYGIYDINWNFNKTDYLLDEIDIKFDLIVGNPPYIQYRNLDKNDRELIKGKFVSCKKGKPDYYYAFIEKSIENLSDRGKLLYLIPSNIFKNRFGNEIRKIMISDIDTIVDYKHEKIFDDGKRNTVSSIIKIIKNSNSEVVNYIDSHNQTRKQIIKKELDDKWVFEKINKDDKFLCFGDFFNVNYSIATLYNTAYLVDKSEISEKTFNVFFNKQIRKAASPRLLSTKKEKYIIFPYEYVNDRFEVYDDFEETGELRDYLYRYIDRLKNRKADINNKWFQYGRSQALEHVAKNKLLISTVITNSVKVFKLDDSTVPFSGIVITVRNNQNQISLDKAINILESDMFMKYVEKVGLRTSTNSYRITSLEIKKYRFEGK